MLLLLSEHTHKLNYLMLYTLLPQWPPTFALAIVVLSLLGDTCFPGNQQLGMCHAAADGLRHDVLMAVITLWIVTADQGHNKTIVAAILEKVLNRGDMLSGGYAPVLNLIIKSNGTPSLARQWQAQTQKKKQFSSKIYFNVNWEGGQSGFYCRRYLDK